MGILDYFTPEARRGNRQALEGLLMQFIPPEMRPQLNLLAELNPVVSMERAGQDAQQLFAPDQTLMDRLAAGGRMASNMAGVVAPAMVAGRAGVPVANAVQDVLTGYSPMVQPFMADEFGGAGVPRINKELLDPIGYQNTKMRDYLSNTQLDTVDTGVNLPRTPISWEDMLGRLVMPFYGDRTSGGALLSGIDDIKFDQPVLTEAGLDFMRGPAAQADDAIWASNNNIVTRIVNEAEAARKKYGEGDIYGMTGTMAPDANDFATFTAETMAEMVNKSPINASDANSFNAKMLEIDPNFVGIGSPMLRQWAKDTTSPNRKYFIRLMDSAPMQAAGFPSPGQVRYGVTDPTQRDMPAGMFGLGVSKLDEVSPILRNTPKGNAPAASVPHSTYNTQITGSYTGSLPPVPQGLIYKEIYDAMEGKTTKTGQPLNEAHKTHAIKTIMPVVPMTEPKIEGILNYLARTAR